MQTQGKYFFDDGRFYFGGINNGEIFGKGELHLEDDTYTGGWYYYGKLFIQTECS